MAAASRWDRCLPTALKTKDLESSRPGKIELVFFRLTSLVPSVRICARAGPPSRSGNPQNARGRTHGGPCIQPTYFEQMVRPHPEPMFVNVVADEFLSIGPEVVTNITAEPVIHGTVGVDEQYVFA